MTQIAPTLAQILGVGLSPRAAKPLTLGVNAETTARQGPVGPKRIQKSEVRIQR